MRKYLIMCDTFIAMPNFTKNGNIIFGKNSDREPNEAQDIVHIPKHIHNEADLKCTFITIPQVRATNEVILSKPFWMWGAEMGVNEHGLVIGNEAVFTKIKFRKTNKGLTGMDLLRLALERCTTAIEAIYLIPDLMNEYGIDVPGGYEDRNFYYHNSYLIADKSEAWILETADIQWAAKKIDNFGAISNGLSIQYDYDLMSENAIEFAIKMGWHKAENEFNFAKSYSNKFMNWASACTIRSDFSKQNAAKDHGNFTITNAFEILKSHHKSDFSPSSASTKDICMHATGLLTPNQSVGSMVVEISEKSPPTIWITNTSNPCLSLFKPVYFNSNFDFTISTNTANSSFWWQAEQIHRHSIENYPLINSLLTKLLDAFQLELILIDKKNKHNSTTENDFITEQAFEMHLKGLKNVEQFLTVNKHSNTSFEFAPFFKQFWKKQAKVFKNQIN